MNATLEVASQPKANKLATDCGNVCCRRAGSGTMKPRVRAYRPTINRRQSEDPIGFVSSESNLYRYAASCPNNSTDPSGLIVPRPLPVKPKPLPPGANRWVCGIDVWVYTGSWCVPNNVWDAAINAAAGVVTCWWNCEVQTHKSILGCACDLAGPAVTVTFTHLQIAKPDDIKTLANATGITTLQSLLALRLKEGGYDCASGLLRRGAQAVSKAPWKEGLKSGIAGVAIVELGISIFCAIKCSK